MTALFHYFKDYIKETILGPLFKLLEASFELLVPLIIARIVDEIIPQNNENHLFMMIFLLFGLALVGVIVAITAQYFSSKAAIGYTQSLSDDLFNKIMSLPKEKRDNLGISSLVTRMISDTYQIQTGINQFLRLFLRSPFIVFGAVIMAFTISPKLTAYFLGMVLTLFAVVFMMSHLLNPIYGKIRNSIDHLVALTREQLEGVRVIRAFGRTESEAKVFQNENLQYKKHQLSASFLSSLVGPLTFIIVNMTLLIIIWQGNLLIDNSLLTQGMLVALINYLLQILTELLKLTMLVTSLNQSFISARRVQEVFDQTSELLEEPLETIEERTNDVAIVAKDLTFTYPNAAKPSLEEISFSLQKGEFLGIIGGTGAGKSTLVNLLANLYQAQSGQLVIYDNGKQPRHLKEWRDWVAVVPQKAQLFKGSIRSNLTLGSDFIFGDEDLKEVLDIAQASEFVEGKNRQLDAEVEAFGSNFSGGQRQRLTIARALVKKAPFLILDDASSALDFLTESRLLTALHEERRRVKGQLIMVSQRTRSLKSADKILVLDQGRLIAQGKHDNLLENCQLYRDIHYSQESQETK
ncbi:ABC transporter ATP-binding protein [Streptococcus pluranimalium]|uniref:ABC transporter ATP-binding protein n=1 Tax=Streptococcus pluranimalium TaxID=82348 RepID=UPI001C4A9D96|nr:ABC transporter ATP-binding protein [Streptococcus pluranimalium]WFM80777.1 ABC transporter ATP-binding protein [Streptococcus pluranimalium]HEM6115608.1 ABC transporter ATP-binding protein [Streptococcus suis]